MTLVESVAIILASLPVPKVDATEIDRNQRLTSIAIAIDKSAERATCTGWYAIDRCKPIAADPLQVAAELIELANAETNLRSNVHRGECLPHQCDAHRV